MRIYLNNNGKYLSITQHLKGQKMEGFYSLSTSNVNNSTCNNFKKQAKKQEEKNGCSNIICAKCYVKRASRYPSMHQALENNFQVLTSELLSKKEIKQLSFLNTIKHFRFESFGEIHNRIQLENYVNIAKNYKDTLFTLWTKNYSILYTFIINHKLPKNLTIMLSNPFIDKPFNTKLLELFRQYHKNIYTFSVTSDKNNNNINCTGKCNACLNCYKSGKKKNVLELLK